MTKTKKTKSGKAKSPKRSFLKYILIFWGTLTLIFLAFAAFIWSIAAGYHGELPSTQKLENPENPLASEVYTDDGVLLGKYYSQNRTNVRYESISPNVIHALIATEDVRYYNHAGIDFRGTASIGYYLLQGKKRGASTISQQLAKNLFPTRQRFSNYFEIIVTKLQEWIIAIQLERNYTKQEIITMYMNTVDFGSNAFGIKAASRTYFNKSPDSLNIQESAVLIGLLKATHQFSPVHNPENAMNRRNTVLMQMYRYGFIEESVYDSVRQLPIELEYNVTSHVSGFANHFREYLRMQLRRWAANNNYNIYTDGLRIYTTIDSRMQEYAEIATRKHLRELQKDFNKHWEGSVPWGSHTQLLTHSVHRSDRYQNMRAKGKTDEEIMASFNEEVEMRIFSHEGDIDTVMTPMDSIKYYKYFLRSGMMAMDSESGHIKAWVSGPSFRYFQYDHVNPTARRQVGSTFKPFVFAVAIMNGYSPCFRVPNVPIIFEDYQNWSPRNVDGKYGGMKTLKEGLSESINTVTAHVIKQVGPEPVVSIAREAGIIAPLEALPAISLGTPDISVFEMVGAFNTFANKGVWVEPTFITRIEDRNGNIIEEFVPNTREVLDEHSNFVMIDMLRDVVDNGTGRRLRFRFDLHNQIAGKTGTTQNHSDGWFIGFVPELTAGVWVGAEDRAIRFRSTHLGQGANTSLPIWGHFMQQVYADESLDISYDKTFERPSGDLMIELDCSKYSTEDGSGSFDDGSPTIY